MTGDFNILNLSDDLFRHEAGKMVAFQEGGGGSISSFVILDSETF